MDFNKTTVAGMVLAGILAGAGGAYLLTSGGSPATPADGSAVGTPAPAAVEQSEVLLTEPAVPVRDVAPSRPTAPMPRPVVATRPAPPRPAARTSSPVASSTNPTAPAAVAEAAPPRTDMSAALPVEPARAIEPEYTAEPVLASPQFVDLMIPAESVLGLQMETSHSSEDSRVEDDVVARVTRDVRVGDRVAIPAGSKAYGEVVLVERGGRLRERARLGVRFTSVVLADGTRVPVDTETIYREGDGRGTASAAKIGGGAIGGAIIGGILGGAKGAAIGGSVGAGAGSAAVLAGDRSTATLPSGTPVTVRVSTPTTVTVEN